MNLCRVMTMAIKVVCLGLPLRGPSRLTIEPVPTTLTLRELVTRYLAPHFEGNLANVLFDAQGLRDTYVVLVNGLNVLGQAGLETRIQDHSEVIITPPVGGG